MLPSESIRSFIALVACVLLVSAVNVAHSVQADTAELVSKIDELAKAEIEQPNCVVLSIGVLVDGKVILDAAYGLAVVEHGVSATTKTPFRSGSLTKQFATMAVMRVVEQGELSLDDQGGGECRSSADTEVRFVFDTTEAHSLSVTIDGSFATLKGSRNSD